MAVVLGVRNKVKETAGENTDVSESISESENTSESTDQPSVSPSPSPSPTPSPEELVNSAFVVPQPGSRPLAVMIDNEGTKSLPQGGLYQAQLIYEIIVEGGETRLMPVFWDVKPEMVGPVRSSRHYFLDYAMEHDAIYVHIGWSPMAERDISVFNVNNVNGVMDGWVVFYDITTDRNNWQDSYTNFDKIFDFAKNKNYRLETEVTPLFVYNEANAVPAEGEKAEKVSIRYSSTYTCGFEYDEVTKTYKRIRKGKPHMERITEEQLTAKNIIVQKVTVYDIKGDTEGRQEVVTTGSGKATYITCGKAVLINWEKDERTGRTKYTYPNGDPLVLNPGQTWIQIVPNYGEVSIE
ncbi:MAG TPA: DUF3048 domain-containing protein [Clostridiaceae bacterium]|nr:DUF3048 domain-containing protein [Clostridiaceae bacterium]